MVGAVPPSAHKREAPQMPAQYTPPQASILIAQRMAEAMWAVATSEDHSIAYCRSATYLAVERALLATLREVYHLTPLTARKVRDLLAEYGPLDSLSGTTGWDIASYVQFARTHNRNQYHY